MRDGDLTLLGQADARRIPLPDESVQAVITSPPYWGLRRYDVSGEIGLEQSPDEYVAQIVAVFREVKRVLRSDGVAWLVLGDSYFGDSPTRKRSSEAWSKTWDKSQTRSRGGMRRSAASIDGLKPKDLCMIPARVALALQADGWWLRSDIIWAKGVSFCPTYSGSVMPESVRDRPTQSYEHIFLLAKSKTYYYDNNAVREPVAESSIRRISQPTFDQQTGGEKDYKYGINPNRSARAMLENFAASASNGRNLRSVWTINPKPSRLAHYATFPVKLVEPMVLAGTSAKGCCPECGKPWERVVEMNRHKDPTRHTGRAAVGNADRCDGDWPRMIVESTTTGWRPGCGCGAELEPRPCVVLDCFGGTMTVGEVCAKHGRHFVGLDLKREYVEMGRERCADTQMAMAL